MKKKLDGLGRLLIPKEVRLAAGINLGDILEVTSDEGKIIITKPTKISDDWRRTEDIIIDVDYVNKIKEEYTKGTRIECICMDDPLNPIDLGTKGTVDHVDDAGRIHVIWDNGVSLALIENIDKFKVIK